MLVAGIDPGLDGALVALDAASERVAAAITMPVLRLAKGRGSKREISLRSMVAIIEANELARIGHVFIERVASSPQMGVASAFAFGRGYGGIEGIVAALGWPVEYVTPAAWKRALAVPREKDDARARACQLMPLDVRHWTPARGVMTAVQAAGRAEAALIALYGLRRLHGIGKAA